MPKGGDRRRLVPGDLTLSYVRLLLEAMRQDRSAGGIRFNAERLALCSRYDRLLKQLVGYRLDGWTGVGQPPFHALPQYLELLLTPSPVRYPRPRPLTKAEAAEAHRRRKLAEIVSVKAHRRWSAAEAEGDHAEERRFRRADAAAWEWALVVERTANPNRETRTSRRLVVQHYLAEVAAFCGRWGLHAGWAVPTFVDHHFHRLTLGEDQFLIVAPRFWEAPPHRIVVQVPGATGEEYGRDRRRFGGVMLERSARDVVGDIKMRWIPDQSEQAAIEREYDSACVTVNWDASQPFPSNTKVCGHDNVLDYVVEECEARLRRRLTKGEVRLLSRDVDREIAVVTRDLRDAGWTVAGAADRKLHASWLARKLLDTKVSWLDLARSEVDRWHHPRAIQRACRAFAQRAGLSLPAAWAGRAPIRSAD